MSDSIQEIKNQLYQKCIVFATERISSLEQAITSAQEAAANDTKSSAGDKYETTREMMQQEISRNQAQLFEAKKLKHALDSINPLSRSKEVKNGSLVITSNGNFYISISAGQLKVGSDLYFAVSPASPVGKILVGLKSGDKATFKGKEFVIQEVA
ncbi:3-oxoacyl-ACP synthase [Desertivirga arenae]|uniref:3-oxoacyl-ACP synthase n=1 Tax=Desertivirga arenae TaxID=2810309 RepID=UPI001F606CF3|nr:3-oxoacyl-ACP synthase [Pedobacter sp. SYSU D00823]